MPPLPDKLHRLLSSPAAIKQLVKFLLGGALTFATDYLTFTALILADTPLFITSTASFLAGFAVSFTVNKLWVFGANKKTQHKKTQLQVALYVALLAFNIAFTYYFILLMSELGLSVFVGKLLTILMVTAWNFVLYKKVIFKLKD